MTTQEPGDGDRLARVLGPVVRTADMAARMAHRLGGLSAASVAVLALIVVRTVWPVPAWGLALGLALVVFLLLPSAVLVAFGYGLGRLGRIPTELAASSRRLLAAGDSGEAQDVVPRGAAGTVWRAARQLLRVREVVEENLGVIAEAGWLVRLVNPATLVAVLVSVGATVVLTVVAAAAAALALIL